MFNPVKKITAPEQVKKLGELREQIWATCERLQSAIASGWPCGEEARLAMRELRSARHWLGECKGYYDTGFEPSDLPKGRA
jgi:hypothetical protein